MSGRMTIASVSFAVLAVSSVATAQGNGPLPRDGACFYEDTQYRGRYFCVDSGDSLDSMPSGATIACPRFASSAGQMSVSFATRVFVESLCG